MIEIKETMLAKATLFLKKNGYQESIDMHSKYFILWKFEDGRVIRACHTIKFKDAGISAFFELSVIKGHKYIEQQDYPDGLLKQIRSVLSLFSKPGDYLLGRGNIFQYIATRKGTPYTEENIDKYVYIAVTKNIPYVLRRATSIFAHRKKGRM